LQEREESWERREERGERREERERIRKDGEKERVERREERDERRGGIEEVRGWSGEERMEEVGGAYKVGVLLDHVRNVSPQDKGHHHLASGARRGLFMSTNFLREQSA